MKKILFFIAFLAINNWVFSQKTEPAAQMTKQEYLNKSKSQKTTAWILLGGGAALTTVGAIVFRETFSLDLNLFGDGGVDNSNSGAGGIVIAGIGIAAMGGSIPLFIASARNKNKAMAMTAGLKFERQLLLQQCRLTYQYYPAVAVRFSLK